MLTAFYVFFYQIVVSLKNWIYVKYIKLFNVQCPKICRVYLLEMSKLVLRNWVRSLPAACWPFSLPSNQSNWNRDSTAVSNWQHRKKRRRRLSSLISRRRSVCTKTQVRNMTTVIRNWVRNLLLMEKRLQHV